MGPIVLETGLGGRLDATNAIPPEHVLVTVITPIALDHQQWLGETLAEIAGEKAGIIKPGVPLVSARQEPEAERVIRQAAASRGAKPVEFLAAVTGETGLRPGLEGPHQMENAALAVAALRAAGLEIGDGHIERLAAVRWRGRFERLLDGRVIVDGAHNSHAASALAKTWRRTFGRRRAQLIFGSVAGKDPRSMLRLLAPLAREIVYVSVDSSRGVPAQTLADLHPEASLPRHVIPSLEDAMDYALQNRGRVLITGSLFLAGEAISLVEKKTREPSDQ